MKKIIIILVSFFAYNSYASRIDVLKRVYNNSCGYYSVTSADVKLYYSGVPDGAKVKLVYGLGNKSDRSIDWEDRTVTDTYYPGLTQYRAVDLKLTIHERSSPKYYNVLQFVWEVTLPNGAVYYDKGSSSSWGFYEADLSSEMIPCTGQGQPLPSYELVKFYTFDRN